MTNNSLRASGWKLLGERGGGSWSRKGRPRLDKAPTTAKMFWESRLPKEGTGQ